VTSHIVIAGIARRKTRVNALMTGNPSLRKKLLAKKMDHPKSGLPDFGHSNTQVGYIRLAWSSPRVTHEGRQRVSQSEGQRDQ
jgi:hypothetical protein